jgi:Zn-dependent peptidase ImmA (M78 family)/transcriptional regulator with XRE-family HTH domain
MEATGRHRGVIQPLRVKQARELHRLTQIGLVRDVPDLTQPRLSDIEKGRSTISSDDIAVATIAAVTGVTVDWLSTRPSAGLDGLSPHFRARSRTTESTKASGRAWANLVNEAHDVLADRVRALPVQLEMLPGTDPQHAARLTRRSLGFDALEPLPYLVLAIERMGVRVLGLPWNADTVDAFCAWAGPIPTIALASDVPGDRLRWTVAHELAHLVLHHDVAPGKQTEAEADAFAAELLTPIDALRQQMPAHPTLQTLTMMKSQWRVSIKSLVRRARELGAVDQERATSLYRQISARGWNKAEPGYVPVEKPRALRKKIEIAVPSGHRELFAAEMGWSLELTDMVLEQHASAEELPSDADSFELPRDSVVVPLTAGRKRS